MNSVADKNRGPWEKGLRQIGKSINKKWWGKKITIFL